MHKAHVTDLGYDFLHMTQIIKAKVGKWDYIKLKSFYSKQSNQQHIKATYNPGESICSEYV